jgi:hypothetical protein
LPPDSQYGSGSTKSESGSNPDPDPIRIRIHNLAFKNQTSGAFILSKNQTEDLCETPARMDFIFILKKPTASPHLTVLVLTRNEN